MNENSEATGVDRSSDGAIKTLKDDLLHRDVFAEKLAAMICKRKGRQSFVIGLQGPWGCGKSSIKYMVIDSLNKLPEDDRPLIIEFDPWQFRGSDALFQMFFDEIASALGKTQPEVGKNLKRLAGKLAAGSTAIGMAGLGLTALGIPVALIPLIANALKNSSEFTSEVANTAKDNEADNDLVTIKRNLAEELNQRKNPVLVIIDDIDRLYAPETALIFQLVKANADFPNFIYLLLYDREIVAQSLSNVVAGKGDAYLEKIVQHPINVPIPNKRYIEAIWISELKRVHAELELATEADPNVWEDLQTVFNKALFFYIENLRDVWRTVNALELSLPLVVKDNHLDVNLVDFVVLEVIRVLEARLYESLLLHKNTLLGLPNTWEQTQLLTKQIGANYSIIGDPLEILPAPSSKDELITLIHSFSQNNQRHEELLTILLRGLFPNAPWKKVTTSKVFDNMLGWDKHDTALKVSDESYFERNFQLRLDATDLTEKEIFNLVNSTNCEYIRQQLRSYDADKRLVQVIGRILTRTKEGTKVCSFECLAVLLEIGDWPYSYSNNPPLMIIQEILQSCIKQPNQKIEERIANLKTVLETSKAIFWPVYLLSNVAMLVADRSWRGETLPIFEECKVVVSHRIQQQANANILHTHPGIDQIMIFWRQQNEQKLNEWVLKIRDDFPKLISVLKPWERYWIEGGTPRQEGVDELLHYFPFVSIAACVNHFYIDNGDDSADLSEEVETAGFYKRHFPRLADSNESQTQ